MEAFFTAAPERRRVCEPGSERRRAPRGRPPAVSPHHAARGSGDAGRTRPPAARRGERLLLEPGARSRARGGATGRWAWTMTTIRAKISYIRCGWRCFRPAQRSRLGHKQGVSKLLAALRRWLESLPLEPSRPHDAGPVRSLQTRPRPVMAAPPWTGQALTPPAAAWPNVAPHRDPPRQPRVAPLGCRWCKRSAMTGL